MRSLPGIYLLHVVQVTDLPSRHDSILIITLFRCIKIHELGCFPLQLSSLWSLVLRFPVNASASATTAGWIQWESHLC
jgi:hypothetical protein